MNIQPSSSPSYSGYDEIQKKVFQTVSNALQKSKSHQKNSRPKNPSEELDDLEWEYSDDSLAEIEDVIPFRMDIVENETPKEQGFQKTNLIQQESRIDHNPLDFHRELEKAEILVNLEEKLIQRHMALLRNQQVGEIKNFIQDIMSENGLHHRPSIQDAKFSTNSKFKQYIPSQVPILNIPILDE